MALVVKYRLCLIGLPGRPVAVRRFFVNTDEGAIVTARGMLSDDPTLIGFDLWDGPRKVVEERRRVGVNSRVPGRASRRPRPTKS